MIGKITGSITEYLGQEALLETNAGVSYRLFVPTSLRTKQLPFDATLYTHLHVRDDAMVLYGFLDRDGLELFQLMNGVSGVGPKTAYLITISSDHQQLIEAVRAQDVSFFTKIPGLGKKTALKVLLELSSKLKQEFRMPQDDLPEDQQMLFDGLRSLGFSQKDIATVLPKIDMQQSLEAQITAGIQQISRSTSSK